MAEKQQQPTTEEMFGIAKKFALQLKAFPLETESAIVEMVRVSMQHRNLQLEREQQLAEMALKEKHIAMQQQQMQLQQMAFQRESASLVPTGNRPYGKPHSAGLGDTESAGEQGPEAQQSGPVLVPSEEEVAEFAGEPSIQ